MKKRILKIAARVVLCSTVVLCSISAATCTSTTSEDYIPSETLEETSVQLTAGVTTDLIEYVMEADVSPKESVIVLSPSTVDRVETKDKNELINLVAESELRVTAAEEMKNSCMVFGYEEDNPAVVLANEEYTNAEADRIYYQSILDQVIEEESVAIETQKWIDRENEYPVATIIWKYLKELGYNDYVTAGIIGNMMAEVGGQTLNIDHTLSTGSYYGLCQWKTVYYPSVRGMSRSEQLNLLATTIEDEFSTFGYMYSSGFSYSDFLELQGEQAAALAFAKVYERCGSGSYSVRESNATTAYEYFTN